MLPSSCRVLASLVLLAALAAPASAAVSHTHQADLRCYRLIGGQPLRVDLRTTLPSTPFVLFFSLNGTPSVVGSLHGPLEIAWFPPLTGRQLNVTDRSWCGWWTCRTCRTDDASRVDRARVMT